MKIFPHILCRIASLSFEVLENLHFSDSFRDLLEKERVLEMDLEGIKIKILKDLKSFDTTFSEFLKIRKFKKQIHKKQYLDLSVNIFENNNIFNKLLIYNDLIDKIIKINHLIKIEFEKENLRIKTKLQTLSHHIDFQNALPLSSISFAKSLQKYWDKNPKDFRKKELQTEQTVMQYIARMAAKTSPFSSFTKVNSFTLERSTTLQSGVQKIKNLQTTLESGGTLESGVQKIKNLHTTLESCGTLSFNNFLLQLFQSLFIFNSKIFNYLKIRINSTLEKQETEYRFLVNFQNVESFQRVEIQPILELFESYFTDNQQIAVFELIHKIGEEVESEEADLINFVKELVEIGFLEVDFDFNGNTENWLIKLRDFVKQTPVFDVADVTFFNHLEQQLLDFSQAMMWQRILILENLHQTIDNFLKKYKFEGNLKAILSPEQLIYEDVATAKMPHFEEKAIEKLIFSIHNLLEKVNFLKGKERLQIEYFFNQFYDENAIVPLLDFYENYFKIGKQIKETDIPAIQTESELLRNWAKAVGKMVSEKYKKDENLILKIEDFEAINERLKIKTKPLKASSLACLALMYEEDGELKAVLNSVTQGYGKMTGRFLKLMPKAFTEDLRRFNADLETDNLMADNVDASFFNANIHLPLLKYEISMPKSQNQLPDNQQFKVKDLAICNINNEIVLWHLELKKKVEVFDLGIQTLKGRSSLYQLLMNFSPIVPDLQYLKEAIEVIIPQNGKNYMVFPRVIFENWVLFRKEWIFKNWEINHQIKYAENWKSIQEIKKILMDKKIEDKFYIKIQSKISSKIIQNKSNEKPIYVDVNNIFLLKIFMKLISNENKSIKITEILPISKNLLKINEQPYCIENVLQWYKY